MPDLGTIQRTITGLSDKTGKKTVPVILDLTRLVQGQSSTTTDVFLFFLPFSQYCSLH